MVQSDKYYKSRAVGVMSEAGLTTDWDLYVLTCLRTTTSPRYRKSRGTSHYTTISEWLDIKSSVKSGGLWSQLGLDSSSDLQISTSLFQNFEDCFKDSNYNPILCSTVLPISKWTFGICVHFCLLLCPFCGRLGRSFLWFGRLFFFFFYNCYIWFLEETECLSWFSNSQSILVFLFLFAVKAPGLFPYCLFRR